MKLPRLKFRICILGLLTMLTMLLLLPSTAQAERSFSMQSVIVDAEVLPDASMRVTERLTIDFLGQWNGFFVSIPQGSTPIVEVAVHEGGLPYTFNPGQDYGPPGTYLLKIEGDDILIDWSISALDQVRTFDVSYRVINAVSIHTDTAELYRKFIGDANENDIATVQVNLKLPAGSEKYQQGEAIKIWGHGPLQGEVDFGGDGIVWRVNNLPAYTFMEGRVIMPTALFPEAPPTALTGQPALASILEEEADWAGEANRVRQLARAETGGAAAVIAGVLWTLFFLWRKYGRRFKTSFEGDYYRDLPGRYSPAELGVLWTFKSLQARDMTATILDLGRRRFLSLQEESIEVRRILGTKEVMTYRLSFLSSPEPATLKNAEDAVLRTHEQDLIDFLKDKISEGRGYLYLHDIEQYSKKNGEAFYEFWERWTEGLNARGDELGFFDDRSQIPARVNWVGMGLLVLGMIASVKVGILGYAAAIAGAALLIVPRLFKRRSLSGEEDYVRWQAFKKFLEHFSDMEHHEIPSLIIWEHYLVYAVTLGIAKEVINQLELVYPNLQQGDYRFGHGWITYGTYGGMGSLQDSFDGISNPIDNALQSAERAVGRSSSGSGGGGGFSGGGGGGGGGSSFGGR